MLLYKTQPVEALQFTGNREAVSKFSDAAPVARLQSVGDWVLVPSPPFAVYTYTLVYPAKSSLH